MPTPITKTLGMSSPAPATQPMTWASLAAKYPKSSTTQDQSLPTTWSGLQAKYANYKAPAAQPDSSKTPKQGFLSRIIGGIKKYTGNVADDYKSAGQDITNQVGKIFGNPNAKNMPVKAAEAGLNTAGDIAGAAISPVTELPPVKAVLDKLSSIAGESPGGQKLGAWATKHPEAAKDLGSIANIAGLALGGEAEDVGGSAMGKGVSKVSDILGSRSAAKNLDALVDETTGVADKKTRISALEQTGMTDKEGAPAGGTKQTLTKGIKAAPDKTAIARAESVRGIIKPGASPVDNLTALNKEISRISEKEVSPALEKAGSIAKISEKAPGWSPIVQRMNDIEKPDIIKADTTLNRTYDLVRKRMIEQIQKQPATVKGLWDARKAFDGVVKNQFGDVAFDSEKNTAIKRAISDMRREVNTIIGEKVPAYKGQMNKLSDMYDARYNIAENYQDLVNKGGLKAFKALNPKKYTALKWGSELGVGIVADKILKNTTGIGI